MESQFLIALAVLITHIMVSVLLILVRPMSFVRYHVVFAALFAAGLLEMLGEAKLLVGSSEIKITGLLWLVSLCLMVAFVCFHIKSILRLKDRMVRHYCFFIGFAIIVQLLMGTFTFSAMLHFLEILYPFFVLMIAHLYMKTQNDSRSMVRAFVWYAVILLTQVPINYLVFGYDDLNVLKYSRVMSTSLLPAFFLFLGLGVHRNRGWFVPAALLLAIPLMTVSRGVTVAIILSLIIFGFRRLYTRRQFKQLAFLLIAMLAITVGVLNSSAFMERSIADGGVDPLDEEFVNTSGRLRIWLFFLEKTMNATPTQLAFGEGLGASDEFTSESDPSQWFKQPHSEYIRFFYNFGVVGLIAYFSIYTGFLKRTKKRKDLADADPAFVDASTLLVYSLLILALYENFLLYNPFGFIQNTVLLFAMTSQSQKLNQVKLTEPPNSLSIVPA